MNIQNLSEREILALQYSLLEEMKQKPKETVVTATFDKEQVMSAEEYIKQRFTNEKGNLETDDQYLCRLDWFEHGCVGLKKFSKGYKNYKYTSIADISSQFKWAKIKSKAIELGYRPKTNSDKFVDKTKLIKRDSPRYNQFRQSVLKRDKVCQCCGSNEDLEVHHLFSFKNYNSLGADTKNGIALCKECHTQYHSQYGTKKNNNPVTFAQFLRDYGMTPQTKLPDTVFDVYKPIVLKLIEKLQDDYAGDCPVKVLTSELKGEFDLLEEQCNSMVTTLKQKGLIYEPTTGYVKVVD